MGNSNYFAYTGKHRRLFLGMMALGIAAIVIGLLINPTIGSTRIWANFLVNTIFFLGIALLGLFFVATHTMAFGGWHLLVRRIPEALSTFIPVGVGLLLVVVVGTLMNGHHLYHWTDTFLTQDTVTVEDLRAYEADHHGHGDEAEHGDEHAQASEPEHNLIASLGQEHDAEHAGATQDDGHGADVHAVDAHEGDDGHSAEGHDADHAAEGHDDGHAAANDHGDDGHGGDAAAADHGLASHDAAGHTDGDHGEAAGEYKWYYGKVSKQGSGHHAPAAYAGDYTDIAATTLIANPHFDALLGHKEPFLNKTFFTIRFAFYALVWIGCFWGLRRASLREDQEGGLKWYHSSKRWAAAFMVLFGVTSSMMAWDFLMSIDAHWFSTMYGWYNAASLWVACVAVTTLLVIYLKNQGYMPQVNESHLHDLGKYLFGFSVFWAYLWFSQYMLIWYANLPEETVYFHARNGDPVYRTLFFVNLGMNFFVPFLVLVTRNAKRKVALMAGMAASLVITHWLDIFLEVMPGTVGDGWSIGLLEIGMLVAFAGLFLFIVFRGLSKASLVPQKHPFYLESVTHHT